jgi:hypothetical protein
VQQGKKDEVVNPTRAPDERNRGQSQEETGAQVPDAIGVGLSPQEIGVEARDHPSQADCALIESTAKKAE